MTRGETKIRCGILAMTKVVTFRKRHRKINDAKPLTTSPMTKLHKVARNAGRITNNPLVLNNAKE
jgi:hypothetical protein